MSYQIAVDIGGTFTDGVLLDEASHRIWVGKTLTTNDDPGNGIADVVRQLLAQKPDDDRTVTRVVHGTTLITNTLLERKGSRVALIVNRGTRDTLDIRRELRYDIYDLTITFPPPLVAPDDRYEVSCRIGPDGLPWQSVNQAELADVVTAVATSGAEAVGICLLHAAVSGDNEQKVANVMEAAAPELPITLSSELAAEIGEYERMSTVAANAYVQPKVARYLGMLDRRLRDLGVDGRIDIMVSNGGFTDAEQAARFPIRLLESGPAGGVLSAINCGAVNTIDRLLAFDMGGTTAKSCLAVDGKPEITHLFEFAREHRFKRGSGLPAKSPSIDLIEIGAGGGSIARIDGLGLLQVGPDSAGSEPGPACYGLGGETATVTDADLVLGYLDSESFLGGRMKLDVGRAYHVLTDTGKAIGLDTIATAWGIHDIVNENMAAAARTHIAEKGHDARRFAMIATGGAGPVHAVDVARRLRIRRIVCPVASGVGSCLGFLAAPARSDRSWSKVEPLLDVDMDAVALRLDDARVSAGAELASAGIDSCTVEWRATAEVRYVGQGNTVDVPIDAKPERSAVLAGFEAAYNKTFGRLVPGGVPEVVTWRLVGTSPMLPRSFALDAAEPGDVMGSSRAIYLPASKGFGEVPVYDRYTLSAGTSLEGPLVMVEPESTLVVAYPADVAVLEDGSVEVVLTEVSV
ncbi:MAG: hydantoinase/oxoprolinase family protein [Alphaproteobacteria bacterium]|nr:hydantoinase/oxoprolinase family protein [Alphaproteobacteria bacterium]